MGKLIDGVWTDAPFPTDETGRFRRAPTTFRGRVERSRTAPFPAAAGRYHLYVSHACPWAHRTMIARSLRGLESTIGISVVDPFMGDDGWFFSEGPDCLPDSVNGATFLREIYLAADPRFTGRVTVPVLWDRERKTIVNNESREIVQMFDDSFLDFGRPLTLRPAGMGEAIDAAIDELFEPVNNGVYRAGFARTQQAYDEAIGELFDALERYEQRLAGQRFLLGDVLTEADICLFTTLVRFDAVYVTHFKCNLRRIVDFPHLWDFTRALYQLDGVARCTNFRHIKEHYYRSHASLNPQGIIPAGPLLDFGAPTERGPIDLSGNRVQI